MFAKNSRYAGQSTVKTINHDGEDVAAVTLRLLGSPVSFPAMVTQGDQLDVISQTKYKDATRYWYIADANTELEANSLTDAPGRMIQSPKG